MANFLDERADGGETWRSRCGRQSPHAGPNGLLAGPWADAIVAAVACEKAGQAHRFADGPAGQVLEHLEASGFGKFMKAAEATEKAAHEGRLCAPCTVARRGAGHGAAAAPWDTRPVCQYGTKCYRKNPEHFKEFAHPWLEDDGKGGWPPSSGGGKGGGGKGGSGYPAAPPPGKGAGGGGYRPGMPVAGGGKGGATGAAAAACMQVRCGRCGAVNTVQVPPGTKPGTTVRMTCPNCGAVNEVPAPGGAGGVPAAVAPGPCVPAPSVGGKAPRLTGRRRALLVGVNYFGTRAELRGCINDVHNIRRLLVETFRWQEADIRTLTDDGRGGGMPTRFNIEKNLRWLAEGAAPGDLLFFSFSGHGAQQEDPQGLEEDGMNETILPVDFAHSGMITDDEVGDYIVKPLPEGVRLTAVLDCCHSGTGLDLPFSWDARSGCWREEVNPYHSLGDVLMFSGCEDDDTSSDASGKYRAPGGAMTTAFCDVLRQHPRLTYPQLLNLLHAHLRSGHFSQRPVLTSSQQFHFDRQFGLDDIHPNTNPQIGRTIRQRFPPQPRPMSGPLAEMLGPLGMLAAGMAAGMVLGELAEGAGGFLGGGLLGGLLGGEW